MKSIILGIDIGKEKFDVTLVNGDKKKSKSYQNNRQGFENLVQWVAQQKSDDVNIFMEATGVYHENAAYFLHDRKFTVHILNPAKAARFASAGELHKTDKSDSRALAAYGSHLLAQGKARAWQPEAPEIRQLKALTGRIEALEQDLQREKNRLEKAQTTNAPPNIQSSITDMIANIEEAIAKLKDDVNKHMDDHPTLKRDRKLLQSIPGIGEVVSLHMLIAYHSQHFSKAWQLAAYVGVIPKRRESGQYKGRTMLSKRGNSRIRAKLYMAAISARRYNPDIAAHCKRMMKNGKTKMQALGAAMRRLCHICFGVLKHQCEYQPQVALAG